MRFEYNGIKCYRTKSNEHKNIQSIPDYTSEALCVLAKTTPINIRTEEAVKQYFVWKGKEPNQLTWKWNRRIGHISSGEGILERNHTDIYWCEQKGTMCRAGVGMFSGNELVTTLKYRLNNGCSNNQAKQAIVKLQKQQKRLTLRKIFHELQQ